MMKKRHDEILKILSSLLVIAVCLSSCLTIEKVGDGEQQEIAMEPFSTLVAKSSSQLGLDKTFGVYAFYSDLPGSIEWRTAFPDASEYFSDAKFANKGTYWSGTPNSYYWPLGGSLMFAGYCPHKDESDGTITSVSMVPNKVDINPYFQIEFTQKTTPSEMVDLLWFDIEDSGMGKTLSKTDNAINVQFRHAMSKVSFQFVDSYNHYKITSVILEGSVNKGTFYSGLTPGWLPDLTVVAPYTLLSTESGSAPLLNNWSSPNLYIIPQYLDGIFPPLGTNLDSGVDVVLTFTLTDLENFGSQTISIPLKDYTYRWEVGDYYHYTVTVNSDPIEFGTPSFDITLQTVAM